VIRAGPAVWLAPALAAVASAVAGATPPPPEPIATYAANQPVCLPHSAILLADGERGARYSDDWLMVTSARLRLGIMFYPAAHAADAFRAFRANGALQPVDIPGIGRAQRHPVVEWPGNRRRGWAYWLPQGAGASPDYLTISADQFTGAPADYPVLRRVLTGDARRRICPHS